MLHQQLYTNILSCCGLLIAVLSRQVTEGDVTFTVHNPPSKSRCTDVPPDSRYTCAQQVCRALVACAGPWEMLICRGVA